MIETIVPIGYLHLINVISVIAFMFLLVFLDMKKHNRVIYDRVIFLTCIFPICSSILIYNYQYTVPFIIMMVGLFVIVTLILFSLYYIAKYMEKCAKLLLLKMKNSEEEKNGD